MNFNDKFIDKSVKITDIIMDDQISLLIKENLPINLIFQSFPYDKIKNLKQKEYMTDIVLNNCPILKKGTLIKFFN